MDLAELVKLLIGIQISLAGMFGWHLFKCRDTRIDIATIKQAIERIESDIGTSDSGIRGRIHKIDGLLNAALLEIEIAKRTRHEI